MPDRLTEAQAAYFEQAVKQGTALLDAQRPGWRDRIGVRDIEMDDARRCILGRLYGTYQKGLEALWPGKTEDEQIDMAESHGFQLAAEHDDDYWEALWQLWDAELKKVER